jgi:hypothetical protein
LTTDERAVSSKRGTALTVCQAQVDSAAPFHSGIPAR